MLLRLSALLLLMSSLLNAAPYSAIRDGERFRYRASWGVFSNAGEIVITAKRDDSGPRPLMRIVMETSTKGIVRGFYPYFDRAEAFIDIETGRILRATDKAENGEKLSDSTTTFDYSIAQAAHTDLLRPGRNGIITIPEGDPVDLISALIQTRDWAVNPGEKREALIFAGRDIYPVTITAQGYETVHVAGKDTKALLLVPRMEKVAPRGIFKKGGEIKVWVAATDSRLPVRMQLRLKIGTATLALLEHTESPSAQPGATKK